MDEAKRQKSDGAARDMNGTRSHTVFSVDWGNGPFDTCTRANVSAYYPSLILAIYNRSMANNGKYTCVSLIN